MTWFPGKSLAPRFLFLDVTTREYTHRVKCKKDLSDSVCFCRVLGCPDTIIPGLALSTHRRDDGEGCSGPWQTLGRGGITFQVGAWTTLCRQREGGSGKAGGMCPNTFQSLNWRAAGRGEVPEALSRPGGVGAYGVDAGLEVTAAAYQSTAPCPLHLSPAIPELNKNSICVI